MRHVRAAGRTCRGVVSFGAGDQRVVLILLPEGQEDVLSDIFPTVDDVIAATPAAHAAARDSAHHGVCSRQSTLETVAQHHAQHLQRVVIVVVV